jgi:hypothetical protein
VTSEDDCNLSSYEFMQWLDDQPELDVVRKNEGKWEVIILADRLYMVRLSMWELILTIKN